MRDILNLFVSEYRQRKITDNLFFKFGMGCLAVLFLIFCAGACVILLLLPVGGS
jgi:hypothetical protein